MIPPFFSSYTSFLSRQTTCTHRTNHPPTLATDQLALFVVVFYNYVIKAHKKNARAERNVQSLKRKKKFQTSLFKLLSHKVPNRWKNHKPTSPLDKYDKERTDFLLKLFFFFPGGFFSSLFSSLPPPLLFDFFLSKLNQLFPFYFSVVQKLFCRSGVCVRFLFGWIAACCFSLNFFAGRAHKYDFCGMCGRLGSFLSAGWERLCGQQGEEGGGGVAVSATCGEGGCYGRALMGMGRMDGWMDGGREGGEWRL